MTDKEFIVHIEGLFGDKSEFELNGIQAEWLWRLSGDVLNSPSPHGLYLMQRSVLEKAKANLKRQSIKRIPPESRPDLSLYEVRTTAQNGETDTMYWASPNLFDLLQMLRKNSDHRMCLHLEWCSGLHVAQLDEATARNIRIGIGDSPAEGTLGLWGVFKDTNRAGIIAGEDR